MFFYLEYIILELGLNYVVCFGLLLSRVALGLGSYGKAPAPTSPMVPVGILPNSLINRAASARTSDPGASIGHLPSHTIRVMKHISHLIILQSMLLL
jgi:hypothetical protein